MKILKERCEKNLQRVQKKCKRLHSLYLDLHFFSYYRRILPCRENTLNPISFLGVFLSPFPFLFPFTGDVKNELRTGPVSALSNQF